MVCLFRCVQAVPPIPREILMRILALAILAIGTVSIGPAAAQSYDPAYPVCLHKYGQGAVQLLRLQLHVAASVQRVGIGPRGRVRHQSIFRGRGRAPGTTLSAASSHLLNMILRRLQYRSEEHTSELQSR